MCVTVLETIWFPLLRDDMLYGQFTVTFCTFIHSLAELLTHSFI